MSTSVCTFWASAICIALPACAEPIQLQAHAPAGGFYPISFWPPPEPTSVWISELDSACIVGQSFGAALRSIDVALRRAGYTQTRLYPIGSHFDHGLAVATTLERIGDEGVSRVGPNRWVPEFEDPATLIWLEQARRFPVGTRGRYRVYLVALTDLVFVQKANRATVWNDQTWMGELDRPAERFPASQLVPSRYRIGTYIYEYAASQDDSRATFVPSGDALIPASKHAAGIANALCHEPNE